MSRHPIARICFVAAIVLRCQSAFSEISDLETPIAFYGCVLDENGNPAPNITVDFHCNDRSPTGMSTYHAKTDKEGRFSITGIKGKVLIVTATTDGYSTSPATRADKAVFSYAGTNDNFVPNAAKPEVFHLQKNDWATPISFYGKVVDQADLPLPDTTVHFSCNDLSPKGTSTYDAKTDADGMFSITGIRGKHLSVTPSKDSYYTTFKTTRSYFYAGENENFVPSPAKPELFRLQKIGVADPLLHVQAIMGGPKGYRIKRDGTPLEVSLASGKTVEAGKGDVSVECWTDDIGKPRGQHYDWRCKITVPGGGLQPYTEEFPFQAPADGYVASVEINMPATLEKDWGSQAERNYFLKLPNGNYARMNFVMIAAGDHFFQIESFLNPSGSRNLEFDPNKVAPLAK